MITVPKGWEVKRLADIGDCINGLTYSPDDVVDYDGILVLRSSNIQGNKLAFDDNVYVRSDMRIKDRIQANDILICVRNGSKALIGKNALISEEAQGQAHGAFMTVFRTKNYKYIFQLFQSDMYTTQVEKNLGATINSINNSDLLMFQFPMPVSLAEQQKIAEILSGIDRAIEATQTLIGKEKMIKKALMADLLNHGIDEQGRIRTPQTHRYFESLLGMIPEGWEVKCLGKISKTFAGGTPDRGIEAYYKGHIPWVKSGEVNQTKIYDTEEKITDEAIKNSSAKLIKKNTILVAMYGATAGQIAHLKIDACSNQAVLAVPVEKDCNNFVFYALSYAMPKLLFQAQGSGQPNLSKQLVDRTFLLMPKLSEQQKIAQILSAQDRKIESEEANLAKLQNLKKGLMHDLLNGKMRVK